MEESTLIRHAANGDAAAWEPLVLAHQEAVFRLSYLLLGDPDDAEDIAQETFLRAYRAIGALDDPGLLRSWLYRIAHNQACSALRRRRLPMRSRASRSCTRNLPACRTMSSAHAAHCSTTR